MAAPLESGLKSVSVFWFNVGFNGVEAFNPMQYSLLFFIILWSQIDFIWLSVQLTLNVSGALQHSATSFLACFFYRLWWNVFVFLFFWRKWQLFVLVLFFPSLGSFWDNCQKNNAVDVAAVPTLSCAIILYASEIFFSERENDQKKNLT